MNLPAQKLLRFWGIDRAIGYTLIGRAWSVLAGPITLLFVAGFLSPEEQGFYYTFSSVLGLQVFFELGLSFVILQFTSHERARLEWAADGTLQGDPIAKGRLASLFRMALRWYGVVAVLVVVLLLPAGLLFFGTHQPTRIAVAWQLPWIWIVLVSAAGLFISPLLAVLEGCGLVAQVASVRVAQALAGNVALWLVLTQHARLFATPVLNTVALLISVSWLALRYRHFLADVFSTHVAGATISWQREVWPFQWKIAVSWLSGYFIFQLFNPVLFAFRGAVEAGQMGMSINVMTAISAMAIAWVNTKSAPFGRLVAQRDYKTLDRMFFPALWQSFSVIVTAGVGFWGVVLYLNLIHHHFSTRLLDPLSLGLLVATTIINHIVFAEAVYLRAHKQEPFLGISILNGCLIGLSTYFLGREFGAVGMMAGYFILNVLVSLGGGTWIFLSKRRLWHTETAS